MRKSLIKKIRSTSGATLMMALLFFILCAVIGSVILAAAASSAGRSGSADTDANRQRYSLMSAARFIDKELSTASSDGTDPAKGVDFKQAWSVRTVQVDQVGKAGSSSQTMSAEDIAPGEVCHTRGDYVLALDQLAGETYGQNGEYTAVHTSDEEDEAAASEGAFTDKWEYGDAAKVLSTAGLNKSTHVLNTTTGDFTSLREMRDVMAEAVYRNFWDDISGYTGSADTDPWGGTVPSGAGAWKAPSTYSVSVKHLMIDCGDVDDTHNIYPVYADVTMDQDLKMTFELYCGSMPKESDKGTDKDTTGTIASSRDSMICVWVIFKPDTSKTQVSFENKVTQKDIDSAAGSSLPPLTVEDVQEEKVKGTPTGTDGTTTEGDVTITVKYTYDSSSNMTTITTTTDQLIQRTKHIKLQDRSVDFTAVWKKAVITTQDPAPAGP